MTNQETFKSNLKQTPLPEFLNTIKEYEVGGMITVSHNDIQKKIFMDGEFITFASSNVDDDRLGEYLIRIGKIKQIDYDNSVKLLKTTGKRQGQIFVDLGCLTPKELFKVVKDQVKEIALSLFIWTDGNIEFTPGSFMEKEPITLRTRISELIIDGVKRIKNPRRIVSYLGGKDSILHVSDDALQKLENENLNDDFYDVFNTVDAKSTLEELVNSSSRGSIELIRLLYILMVFGIIRKK